MNRIEELNSYKIMDSPPEKELDDLALITAAIFNVPVSIISFIDNRRQWYKAKIGIEADEVPIQETFCQHTLDTPDEILVVEDPKSDCRFKDIPMVVKENGIKYYVGAPLVSNSGQVLGTVCVLDFKKRKSLERQIEAIKLISRKIMMYLELRKIIDLQENEISSIALRLKKLTDLSPGIIFKLEYHQNKDLKIAFVSEGIKRLLPEINPTKLIKNPCILFDFIHPDDIEHFNLKFQNSLQRKDDLDIEYRVIHDDNSYSWHWMKANSENQKNLGIVWYGTVQNITQKMDHFAALEKILYDLSHVIRKPISNMVGLIEILKYPEPNQYNSFDYLELIEKSTSELDNYIHRLNDDYTKLKDELRSRLG